MAEIIEYKGMRWKPYQRALIPDEAPDRDAELDENEARELMKRTGTSLIRCTSRFDDPSFPCFWFVIKDEATPLGSLSSNTRNKVRRGHKRCEVLPASKEEIATEGYHPYSKAFERYKGPHRPLGKEAFRDRIRNLQDARWSFWKVVDRSTGNWIAYSRNRDFGHSCDYTEIKFDPDSLKDYPSYALFNRMDEHYLEEKAYRFVNDGARSISHETGIQDFLMDKFAFRKAYCRLHIFYRPWLGFLVRSSYPFRSLIDKIELSPAQKLSTLHKQESVLKCQSDR